MSCSLFSNRQRKELPFGGELNIQTGWGSSTLALDGLVGETANIAAIIDAFLSTDEIDSISVERHHHNTAKELLQASESRTMLSDWLASQVRHHKHTSGIWS